MRLALPLVAFALVALAAYAPQPAVSASPSANRQVDAVSPADSSEWVNLQVLPDSISHDALIGIMRGFTAALGVRCTHCHAMGAEGHPDFPSDDNPHKDVARGMMRMTWQINREVLPAIDGLHHEGGQMVTCYTCHRGATEPETLPPSREGGERQAPTAEPGHDHGGHDHSGHDHG